MRPEASLAKKARDEASASIITVIVDNIDRADRDLVFKPLDPLREYLASNLDEPGKLKFSIIHFSGHGKFISRDLVDISEDITRETVTRVFAEPERLYRMTGLGFERFIAEIYRGLGFEVRSTKRSHDDGVDLYIERNFYGMAHSYVVQCKHREAPKKKVGVSTARELLGTLVNKAVTAGILVTNYLFSSAAQRIMKSHSTRLFGVDREGLLNLIAMYLAATVAY